MDRIEEIVKLVDISTLHKLFENTLTLAENWSEQEDCIKYTFRYVDNKITWNEKYSVSDCDYRSSSVNHLISFVEKFVSEYIFSYLNICKKYSNISCIIISEGPVQIMRIAKKDVDVSEVLIFDLKYFVLLSEKELNIKPSVVRKTKYPALFQFLFKIYSKSRRG
jgi:hypothetical protein